MPKPIKKFAQISPSSAASLVAQLTSDFPALIFKSSTRFRFHPPRTIFYDPHADHFALQLLHELSHATAAGWSYSTDIERLKIERAAWDAAAEFCTKYHITYDPDYAEASLDTYRDWLHAKSKCPKCGLTRYQTRGGAYHCPSCENRP